MSVYERISTRGAVALSVCRDCSVICYRVTTDHDLLNPLRQAHGNMTLLSVSRSDLPSAIKKLDAKLDDETLASVRLSSGYTVTYEVAGHIRDMLAAARDGKAEAPVSVASFDEEVEEGDSLEAFDEEDEE